MLEKQKKWFEEKGRKVAKWLVDHETDVWYGCGMVVGAISVVTSSIIVDKIFEPKKRDLQVFYLGEGTDDEYNNDQLFAIGFVEHDRFGNKGIIPGALAACTDEDRDALIREIDNAIAKTRSYRENKTYQS